MISERVLLSYSNDLLIQCIRPATVCGYAPRMRLDLSVNMLTMQALSNKVITILGGKQFGSWKCVMRMHKYNCL